jgi:hypothetical protein
MDRVVPIQRGSMQLKPILKRGGAASAIYNSEMKIGRCCWPSLGSLSGHQDCLRRGEGNKGSAKRPRSSPEEESSI